MKITSIVIHMVPIAETTLKPKTFELQELTKKEAIGRLFESPNGIQYTLI